jgi:hypothetical protein
MTPPLIITAEGYITQDDDDQDPLIPVTAAQLAAIRELAEVALQIATTKQRRLTPAECSEIRRLACVVLGE